VELKTYLSSLWRAAPWLLLGTALAVAASVLLSIYVLEPVYSASTTLVVSYGDVESQQSSYSAALTSERLAKTYAVLITDEEVLQRAIDAVGADLDPSVLRESMTVISPLDTSVITLTVEDTDPVQAARLANAIASTFVEYVTDMQSEMGVGTSQAQTSTLYRTSLERAELAAALDSYVRSYGDLVAVYVSLTNEIQARKVVDIVYSKAELDGMGLNLRTQMTETLTAITALEEEIAGFEQQEPALGMTRAEWYDELDRLEQMVVEYRVMYIDLINSEASLVESRVQQEQNDLSMLMQQRDLEMQAQVNLLPAPAPLPAATPGAPLFESELVAIEYEKAQAGAKLLQSEEALAAHLATEPLVQLITQQDIDTRLENLRAELRQKRSTYSNLMNSYVSYVQFLQSNERAESPAEDVADFHGRRAQISAEADLIWQQILDLRVRLNELDERMFSPPGPPLIVTGAAMPADKPSRPDPMLNGIIAGAAALILITLLVLLREYLRVTDERPIGVGI
jgi:capsular polysaccharide biosynthesis protein